MRLVAFLLVVAVLTGCASPRPTLTPLPMLVDRAPPTSGPRALIVLMPGIREVPSDLVERGFVAAVRSRGIAADVVIPDTHIGYFRDRTFIERLRADIVQPARGRGYSEVWLAGISLGGFGSLLYASRAQADEVDGIIALAPYLGDQRLTEEVLAAGGLQAWRPRATAHDAERNILRWLQGYGRNDSDRPPLYIGYGHTDAYATMGGQVASMLPPEQSIVAAGGHAWAPWTAIWNEVLDRAPLPRLAPPAMRATQEAPG